MFRPSLDHARQDLKHHLRGRKRRLLTVSIKPRTNLYYIRPYNVQLLNPPKHFDELSRRPTPRLRSTWPHVRQHNLAFGKLASYVNPPVPGASPGSRTSISTLK